MDAAARAKFEERVRALEAFGHRGSATEHEARAADYLAGELGASGIEAAKEEFSSCSSGGARILVHVVIAAAGAALLGWWPIATIVLGAAALASLILEQGTRARLLGAFLLTATSRNVVAKIPAEGGAAERRIVVLGHYDTQRTGIMWREGLVRKIAPLLARSPGLTKSPIFPVLLAIVLQVAAGALALALPASRAPSILAAVALVILVVAGFVVGEWAVGKHVPGACDNATGSAAVLALAEAWREDPVGGVELVVLLTGSEEIGLLGSAAWARAHAEEIRATPTSFVNVDSLGYGATRFLGREYSVAGMPVAYPPDLVALCSEVAAERGLEGAGPRVLPVASDGLPLLVRGVPGVSILCFEDDGHMPNYHQLTDTSDRLDFDVAWSAVEYAWAVLRRMAGSSGGAARGA